MIDALILTFVGVAVVVGCAAVMHYFVGKD